MLLTAEDFEDRNAVIVLITTGNLEGRQEVVIPAELWLVYPLKRSYDSVYTVSELCVETSYFPTGLTSHSFIKMT